MSPHLRVIAQIGGEVVDAHLDRYHSGAVVADGGGRVQVRALWLSQGKLWGVQFGFYEVQKYQQGVALYAIIMYFGVNFILSNQLFKEPAFIQKLTIKTIKDVGYILIQWAMILITFGCIMFVAL